MVRHWLAEFVHEIGSLPNTFWGIIVLFSSMYIAVHYNSDIGYYFAGVGSTLVGIQTNQIPNTKFTTSDNPKQVKVETNASDSASKN